MRIADLSPGISKLQEAKDALQVAWAEVCDSWRDAQRARFEAEHLDPLAAELTSAFPAIQKLSDTIARAGRECGPQTEGRP